MGLPGRSIEIVVEPLEIPAPAEWPEETPAPAETPVKEPAEVPA